jgi:glycosyl transferase family 25
MKVVYINLKHRTDRRTSMETQFQKYFHIPVERFEAIQQSPGIVGCGKSHLAVLKNHLDTFPDQDLLIFEDDFEFLVEPEDFHQSMDCISDLDFDVVMLSYNLIECGKATYGLFGRVIEAQTASGYLVSKRYIPVLIHLYEWAIPLLESTGQHWVYANDQIWKPLQRRDRWYYFLRRLGKQSDGWSDNSEQWQSYNC